jgi:hypothetical protein
MGKACTTLLSFLHPDIDLLLINVAFFFVQDLTIKAPPPLESKVMKKATRLSVATTVVAMPLSFRNVVGLLGAVLFWPLTVYFPVEMYITGLLQENQCTRRLRSVSIATNGGFKGSLTGIMSTQKVWHSMQGDIAFADSFNIDIEIQVSVHTLVAMFPFPFPF